MGGDELTILRDVLRLSDALEAGRDELLGLLVLLLVAGGRLAAALEVEAWRQGQRY